MLVTFSLISNKVKRNRPSALLKRPLKGQPRSPEVTRFDQVHKPMNSVPNDQLCGQIC